ncbi:hypothetical protein FJ208_01995, partial [Candidatus Gribaldobacteria bacterium]|nr:hypothetical protein [Candidatus Gribaldobacteria bacterium]
WPEYDKELVKEDKINLIVQINGKTRANLEIEVDIAEQIAKKFALEQENVKKWIGEKPIKKVIFVKNKLINFVV